MTVTMFEAKTNLSELVRKAAKGEEVIITSGRERKPVARLQAIEPRKRRLGFMQDDDFVLGEGFWEPLPEEELRLWQGDGE